MSLKQLRLLESSRAIMFTQRRIVTHFPANICLFKPTTETLEKGVKYVQNQQ